MALTSRSVLVPMPSPEVVCPMHGILMPLISERTDGNIGTDKKPFEVNRFNIAYLA
jgi:hypothetical protein